MRVTRRQVPAPADFGTVVIGVPADSEIDLRLRLEAVMEGVLVSGTARARASGECVRCLDDVEMALEVDLQQLYVYPGKAPGGDEDDERELDGELLDLEPVVRDAVVPALPFQPVCRVDCPGLCSQCGARLADLPGHRHDDIDLRWSALAQLNRDRN